MDNPYDLLSSVHEDRWAFGTGFTDPLSGVDTSVPVGVDPAGLAGSCLALGDDALIYSHRLQQWVTRMPELEEETAIANIALDLLGQARLLLSRAGGILGRTEDQLAFFRVEKEFRNVRLAEHEDADFAELVGRLLIFSTWRLSLFSSLVSSPDPVLAAIAAKGVNELTYHRDYAAQWVIRLGDGTDVSHERMERALSVLWPLTGELSDADWRASCDSVLDAAGRARPPAPAATGRDGVHTEAMGYILAELQSVARTYPDATW
jgi:ring-1,2-phenylacetyl-CoA epoxidase subunit PaaC